MRAKARSPGTGGHPEVVGVASLPAKATAAKYRQAAEPEEVWTSLAVRHLGPKRILRQDFVDRKGLGIQEPDRSIPNSAAKRASMSCLSA